MTAKTVTLRMPPLLHEKAKALAHRRAISMNRLFQESMEQLTKTDEAARLFEEFSLIGAASATADVEFAQVAQAEVIRHDS